MAHDEQRKHGHSTPGLVSGRGHERHEEPVRLNHPEPGEDQPRVAGGNHHAPADADAGDLHQPGALGGDVATRSGTARTPADERNT